MADSTYILTSEPTDGYTLMNELLKICILRRMNFSVSEYFESLTFPSIEIGEINDNENFFYVYINGLDKIKQHDFLIYDNQRYWKSIDIVFQDSKYLLEFYIFYLSQNRQRKVSNVFDIIFSLEELQSFYNDGNYYHWAYQDKNGNLKV